MNTKQTIKQMQKDIRNLKLKAFQPSEAEVRLFKDYLSWKNGNVKKNFEILYSKDLELLNEWFEIYCKEYDCTKEEALESI